VNWQCVALRIGQQPAHARELLRLHRQAYSRFWRWSDAAVDHAVLLGSLHTIFGWTVRMGQETNPRSLRNFPVQANGAELLRLACCLCTERGIALCAPIHDAILIEAPLDRLDAMVAAAQAAMADASATVLGGFRLRSDVTVVRYPDRYQDSRGKLMWRAVWSAIAETAPDLVPALGVVSVHG
jgi:DNA polymerase-1